MVMRSLTRIEWKIEAVYRKVQFGFVNGKAAKDAIGILRIISE
jgi:hypothetical protein